MPLGRAEIKSKQTCSNLHPADERRIYDFVPGYYAYVVSAFGMGGGHVASQFQRHQQLRMRSTALAE
jgi:Uri superfamily endonuclease